MSPRGTPGVRRLVVATGDQLDTRSPAFDGFDAARDAVLLCELQTDATHAPQHRSRLVLFFAAMRHFRAELEALGRRVHYCTLDDPANRGSIDAELVRWGRKLRPRRIVVARPGDYRVAMQIHQAATELGCTLDVRVDRHFISTPEEFAGFAGGRRSLVMETFYRRMRRDHNVLMEGDRPAGGNWNYDTDNRRAFGRRGPGTIPRPAGFAPDHVTREVMRLVQRRFPANPGSVDGFDYPVTSRQAAEALDDFIANRLFAFGTWQDAMATGQCWLYHSRLSSSLNLHLLDPREAIRSAVRALNDGQAPINAVEGFVRQVLGWREYVHGIYWLRMPGYARMNALEAELPMPRYMWTAETDMNCVRQCVGQLVEHGYAHHIQRLMVLGLHAMLLGVHPYEVHRWHMSMYVDAVDWASLPNVLGMSQYGDGGIVGTKPYAASGAYIDRMSDYCRGCRYDPKRATGERACPFTTLYWDFLERHRDRLAGNRRMQLQLRNLARKPSPERRAIRARAETLKADLTRETYLA